MEERPIMKCGHTANSYILKGALRIPICVICDCIEQAPKPLLEGRFAVCRECGRVVESDWNLPFFHYQKDNEQNEDSYYCGCYGWD